jgi:uncharacterized membrane protein HdeD (DUF308 family)
MLIFNIGKSSPSGNNLSAIIKAVVAVALGVFLIVTKANAMELVVQIIAGGIIGVNVVAFLISLKFPAMQMSSGSLMSVLIALLLFSFSGPISAVLRYILGGFLFLAGGSQIFALMNARSAYGMGVLSLVMPVLMLLGGCLFFSEELIGNDVMGLMVGVAIIMYGVSKLITIIRLNRVRSQKKTQETVYTQPEKKLDEGWHKMDNDSVKDVDFEKVD